MNNEKEICSICCDKRFENRVGKVVFFVTKCNHTFHYSCLQKWVDKKPSCPLCRTMVELQANPEELKEDDGVNIGRPRITHSFETPRLISPRLASFMGYEQARKSRVDVTRYLCDYIKNHHLQSQEDRRCIIPDTRMRELFDIDQSVVLDFVSLQRYISQMFN